MDNNINFNSEALAGLEQLSARDKQELNQFITQEGMLSFSPAPENSTHMLTTTIRPKGANTSDGPLTYRHVFPKVRTEQMLRGLREGLIC